MKNDTGPDPEILKQKEWILCSAIWYKELPTQNLRAKNIDKGLLICGHRHGHCIDIVRQLCELRTVKIGPNSVGETEQGFLTNLNRFVNRHEAYDIAESANQLNDRLNHPTTNRYLFSEDLY